jgi:hypothetical protein
MKEVRAGVTNRIIDAIEDTRVQNILDRYGIDSGQQDDEIVILLDEMPFDEFSRLYEDYRRTVEADLQVEIEIQLKEKAKQLWRDVVEKTDLRTSVLCDEWIPNAIGLYEAGNKEAFQDLEANIQSEQVSIVTDIHQYRLETREKLRRFALDIGPEFSRPERNKLVDSVASSDDLINTTLYTPQSAQHTTKAVADFARSISRREMNSSADIDLKLAAKKVKSLSP